MTKLIERPTAFASESDFYKGAIDKKNYVGSVWNPGDDLTVWHAGRKGYPIQSGGRGQYDFPTREAAYAAFLIWFEEQEKKAALVSAQDRIVYPLAGTPARAPIGVQRAEHYTAKALRRYGY